MDISSLDTPSLILDKEKVQKNIIRMEKHLSSMGVTLRPHGKTAKNIDVLNLFSEIDSTGITVSTLKEAEYYFSRGIRDIVYAVGIAPQKLERVFQLISQGARITVILDSLTQADAVANSAQHYKAEIPVLIEIDSDGHRSGVDPESSFLLHLGRYLDAAPYIDFMGVITHAGESYACKTTEEIRQIAEQERRQAVLCFRRLQEAGIPCKVVSVGSTPTAALGRSFQGVTEVRAGVFMFQDLVMAGLQTCSVDDIAVSVLTTVIGHQKEKNWIIIDAGWSALSRDRGTSVQHVDQGYGLVCDSTGQPVSGLIVSSVYQEHGVITHREGKPIILDRFPIGRRIRILPNHACATAASFNCYHVTDSSGKILERWERINGW